MEAKEAKTVYEKILAVMSAVNYLNKDGFVETGKGKGYKALTDEKVLAAVRPALVAAGLVILPVKMEQQRTDEQVKAYDGSTKTNRITDVSVTYRIINVSNPDDFVEVVSSGTGVDTQDKGIGKAMTYAKKYAILNSFLIPSGEDTDQISSDKDTEQLMGAERQGHQHQDRDRAGGEVRQEVTDQRQRLQRTRMGQPDGR